MTRINQLESLKVLKAVVEGGSFTAAAKRLKISAARVSKSIEHLESELGSVLFNRSTRHMKITDSGERCYTRALNLIEQWQDLKEELVESQQKPKGKLRISAPMTWGVTQLAPIIDSFMLKFPDIILELQLSDEHVNVLGGQFDLVLRLTNQLADSSLICRKITSYRLIPCAAPSYLIEHGEPQHPSELKKHACLMYILPGAARKWQFIEKKKPLDIYLEPKILSNSSQLLYTALISGRGIGLIPDFVISEDLAAKRLIPILEDFQTMELNLYTLRPGNRMPSHRLKVFHDYLIEHLGNN